MLQRLIKGLLFGVTLLDPLTHVVVIVVLAGVATLACLTPGIRGARTDPGAVLRGE
jgi:ABC-type lipoprotein release transport system permease subunit